MKRDYDLFNEVIDRIKDGMSITFTPKNVDEDDDFLIFDSCEKQKVIFHTNRVPYWIEFEDEEPMLLENVPDSFLQSILNNLK